MFESYQNAMIIPPVQTKGREPLNEEEAKTHLLRQIVGEPGPDQPVLLTGEDLTMMTDSINEHLAEAGLEPAVPDDHNEWAPARTREFLEFTVNEFSWKSHRVHHIRWDRQEESQESWDKIVQQYPQVFPRESR